MSKSRFLVQMHWKKYISQTIFQRELIYNFYLLMFLRYILIVQDSNSRCIINLLEQMLNVCQYQLLVLKCGMHSIMK